MSTPTTTKPLCANCNQPYFRHTWEKERCKTKPESRYEPKKPEVTRG